MKIVMVAPYPEMAQHTEQVCRTYGEYIEVVTGRMERGTRLAKKAIEEGAGVLISRGGTWVRLSQTLSVPVVEIAVTPHDILRALQKVKDRGTKFGVAGFINVISGLSDWSSLLNIEVVPIEIKDDTLETKRAVKEAIRREKVDCLVGDTTVQSYAQEFGVPCILIESGKEAIWDAIQEAKRIVKARMTERQAQESLYRALDRANQGLIVFEKEIIKFANRTILDLIGRDACTGMRASACLPPSLYQFIRDDCDGKNSDVIQLGSKLWFVERHVLSDSEQRFVELFPADDIESIERQVRQRRANTGLVARYSFADLTGKSSEMRFVVSRARQFAESDSSVLIVGETGTGKELLAQSIHVSSARSAGPFVGVNCAALAEQLLESELFGYEEGAFTGARKGGKSGLFELAHGGTIFLDEIGETPLFVQQRLLRVLQERQVMRIGGERIIPIDVRVIAATNQPLWQFVQENKFRKDLFFRLDVLRLNTVPLRERPDDIPEMFEQMLHELWYKRKGVGVRPRIDTGIYPRLQAYHWPGNVREFQNMVDYLLATQTQHPIGMQAIEDWFSQKALEDTQIASNKESIVPDVGTRIFVGKTMDEMERWLIERTLSTMNGDMARASQVLGISRTTLWRKLKQWETGMTEDRAHGMGFA